MNNSQLEMDFGVADDVVAQLRALRDVDKLPDVRPNVLAELDLADRFFRLDTIAGEVYVVFNRRGVSYIDRVDRTPDIEGEFRRRFHRPAFAVGTPPPVLMRQIDSALHGGSRSRPRFDLSHVTEFERAVLLKALQIPFGQVRTYSWVAGEIGRPKAQRAVGSALANNPIPLLIPCHRVVRSDGIIGNYGLGGRLVKHRILESEGANPDSLEEMARAGFRFIGSDTTHIFCYPTCGHGKHLTERHRMQFTSADQARSMGYRACKVCRPNA